MGCCKCEEYKWADPQPVVWRDLNDRGKEYCVFHAPVGQKNDVLGGVELTDEQFNERVFKRIYDYMSRKDQGLCNFSAAIFPYKIELTGHDGNFKLPNISFDHVKFSKQISFAMSRFSGAVSFEDAEFCQQADFFKTNFDKEVNFSEAIFNDIAYFTSVKFDGEARFFACKADQNIKMYDLSAKSMSNVIFNPIDLGCFSFFACEWPQKLGLEILDRKMRRGFAILEELYRAMKRRATEEHDQPLVSRWHFREKLMQLKQMFNNDRSNDLLEAVEDTGSSLWRRAKAWLLLLWHRPHWPKLTFTGLYWATSGFGERYIRAGVWLGVLVLLSFLANAIPQFFDWNRLWFSAAANDTMASIPFAKDIPGDGWVRVARGGWQLLIAIQFTLFAFAVRNHFRR